MFVFSFYRIINTRVNTVLANDLYVVNDNFWSNI